MRRSVRLYAALFDASESAYRQTVLAAFENVADTLSALDEDSNTLTQARRAADAARQARAGHPKPPYQLGAVPWSASLEAGVSSNTKKHAGHHARPRARRATRRYRIAVSSHG